MKMNLNQSKRYKAALEKQPKEAVSLPEAVAVLKSMAPLKFDMTVELVMHLGIDPRHADQALRGSISLPHGIGKSKKVIAFVEEGDVDAAKEAGAVEAGGEDLVKKITDGWMDFDVAVAVPKMMRVVSKLGRVLGPSGKMPSPKAGTVSPDFAAAVKDFAAGKVNYRNDDGGNLHVPVGKLGFEAKQLEENIQHFLTFVKRAKPDSLKGHYINKVSISGTMTPGVEIAMG